MSVLETITPDEAARGGSWTDGTDGPMIQWQPMVPRERLDTAEGIIRDLNTTIEGLRAEVTQLRTVVMERDARLENLREWIVEGHAQGGRFGHGWCTEGVNQMLEAMGFETLTLPRPYFANVTIELNVDIGEWTDSGDVEEGVVMHYVAEFLGCSIRDLQNTNFSIDSIDEA